CLLRTTDCGLNEAAGGVLTAMQAPRRPGTASAPGLRAEGAAVILSQTIREGDDHVVQFTNSFSKAPPAGVVGSTRHPATYRPAAGRSAGGSQPAVLHGRAGPK